MGFVCCTLIGTDSKTWSLFAIHKTHYPILSCFIYRAHFAQLANRDNRQTQPHRAKSEKSRRIGIARYNRTQPNWQRKRKRWRLIQGISLSVRVRLVQPSSFSAMLPQQTDSACLAAFQGSFPVVILCLIAYTIVFAFECL